MFFTAFVIAALPLTVVGALRHPFYLLHLFLLCVSAGVVEWLHPFAPLHPFTLALALALHVMVINGVTMLSYLHDKRAAQKRAWRIPERTLHAFALIGGTPGALYAQKRFRHKTKKASFRRKMWLIFTAQIAGIVALICFSGGR